MDVEVEIEAETDMVEDGPAQDRAEAQPNNPTRFWPRQISLMTSNSYSPILDQFYSPVLGWSQLGSRLNRCKTY